MVGNEFIIPRPRLQVATPVITAPIAARPAVQPILSDLEFEFEKVPHKSIFGKTLELLHHYSLGAFALLFLAVSSSATMVGSSYWSAHLALSTPKAAVRHGLVQPLQGPNIAVKSSELASTMQTLTSQPINLVVEGKSLPVSADTIRGWISTVSNKKGVTYLHVSQQAITKSLNDAVQPYAKAPINQVNSADGQLLAAGKNGTKVGNIDPLVKQVTQALISAKGMQLTVPTESQAFAVVTPAAFDKMLEVNVNTKQMWAYEKGHLVKQFAISAGAPETPTPLGQYQIYSKLSVQDMRGYNPNGTKYFQPHVRWINYFLPGGYAVHGNYWRPLSWFGAVNSSHGCVSLPDDEAKWVYDWAPLGTTVITHG